MSSVDVLVTMASWEDRFLLGTERLLADRHPARVIMFYFSHPYDQWTAENRAIIRAKCGRANIPFDEQDLGVETPALNWQAVATNLTSVVSRDLTVLVDLTTMPREVIWWTFWHCQFGDASVEYVYHSPADYGAWLSRDPERPRLVFRMSGLASLRRRTALVILAGYDVERAQQLINFFEPSRTVIGLQQDAVDPKNHEQMNRYREHFQDNHSVSFFDTNAYAVDHGEASVSSAIAELRNSHNIILTSLGPKPSAVAIYRMHRIDPMLGLAYAPSREFSREYSTGLGERLTGTL